MASCHYVVATSARGRFASVSLPTSSASTSSARRLREDRDDAAPDVRSLKTTITHVMLSHPVPSPFVSGARQKSNIYAQTHEYENNKYFIHQQRYNTVKAIKSRTVSTGQKGSKAFTTALEDT